MHSTSVLFAWMGNTDIRSAENSATDDVGPILGVLLAASFPEVHLLSDHDETANRTYVQWLKERYLGQVVLLPAKLAKPPSFEEIYKIAD